MTYVVISGTIGLIAFAVSLVRIVWKSTRRSSGDYVAQDVLTRLDAESHDRP